MPNVEIHVCPDPLRPTLIKGIRQQIVKIFADWSCAKEMITDEILSDPSDLRGVAQPYLRVYDTNEEEGGRIVWRLRLEGFDVEFIYLDDFFAKSAYSRTEIIEDLQFLASICDDLSGVQFDISRFLCCQPEAQGAAERLFTWGLSKWCEGALYFGPPHHASPRPGKDDLSPEANQIRRIRWTQMRNVVSGK